MIKKPARGMKKAKSASRDAKSDTLSRLIDARIEKRPIGGARRWRASERSSSEADPDVVEAGKWRSRRTRGVPVWEHAGIVCTGETYKAEVKLTFAKGAALDGSCRLFNASLDGNVRRAIDIHEGDTIDARRSRRSSAPPRC